MKFRSFGLALLLTTASPALVPQIAPQAVAQQKQAITLEDIWSKPTFRAQSVPGFNWMRDGRYYSALDGGNLVQSDVTTGKPVSTLVSAQDLRVPGSSEPLAVDGYSFNADEQKILFWTAEEPIYRRSSKANYFVFDRATKKLTPLSAGGKQSYATFSPDGKRVAFARDNNLFVVDLATMQEKAVTTDGVVNKIINGSADWVYEEEFSFAQGFFWSPDSRQLAFYTFDESQVPEYNMQEWGELYPKDYRYKYPKAGEKNSVVSVSVYDVAAGRTTKMDVGPEADQYIPRVLWTKTPNMLSIQRMNRLQNKLELLHADAATGKTQVVLTDTDPAYVDVADDLRYLSDGKQFIFSSEKDGYRHLYLYDMKGKLVRQLTKGNWEVIGVEGLDEKNGQLYFTSTEASPLQRHLYRVSLKGKGKNRLGEADRGVDIVNLSPDTRYYLNYHSAAGEPTTVSLRSGQDGKLVKVLEDNAALRQTLSQYNLGKVEFFDFKTSEGTTLNGWMIKPANFDPSKKYPVLMHVYGGPGSQTVLDNTGGGVAFTNYLWHQMLAQNGYIVVSVDGRGTGARGAKFKKNTYANLGKLETIDQGEGAKYLSTLPYVDKGRIGIWGWSFGGYMAALAMTKQADLFKAGISVAPVTNWRYYDTVYTERFLKTPQENPSGYDDNSPVQFAEQLKGKYLLVHGTGDDNVHFQNSVAWTDALVKANKDYQTLYYPNRNHGISGGNTRLHLYRQMTDFILKNL
ncbi:peptidase S9B dipeptidylpeptidase IV domain protein [Hymenobacter roseosalivarius DSM 11622]|uniref:Peptidase S9B dipeptidylpeptidase IV domain protein n=1 Tax=Hymenobacter roseosalivarius DSM 11622 TaxID=645990 RepID=A0A1W1VJG4_9BACT|nr:S9 family peptidase [Hymenobacter roseosalivarius]SMB93502.1 peptidase S9B dipeptidylpeptidase IV domain protein [Hymenobacter roseosalivarius DSM 11622]